MIIAGLLFVAVAIIVRYLDADLPGSKPRLYAMYSD